MLGFLSKTGDHYALTPDSALFLNAKSPAYAGRTIEFLHSHEIKGAFDELTSAVRQGGTAQSKAGTVAPEHPVWISFARNMGPLMVPAAGGLATLIGLSFLAFAPATRSWKSTASVLTTSPVLKSRTC